MLTKNINFKNFKLNKNNKKIKKDLNSPISSIGIDKSVSKNYKNSYTKKTISKFKKYYHVRVIGMGLTKESIYDFLKHKIKKNFYFINNLQSKIKPYNKKKNYINLVVSKSGNTLETIANSNVIIKNKDNNRK